MRVIVQPLKNSLLLTAIALIVLSVFAVFYPALQAGFVPTWDDDVYVLDNPHANGSGPLDVAGIFQGSTNKVFSPLATLSLAVDYRIFGVCPLWFHLQNIVWHAGSSVLVLFLAAGLGLGVWGALATALVFAVHPVHVESVVWVSQRKDVLSYFFTFARCCGTCAMCKAISGRIWRSALG